MVTRTTSFRRATKQKQKQPCDKLKKYLTNWQMNPREGIVVTNVISNQNTIVCNYKGDEEVFSDILTLEMSDLVNRNVFFITEHNQLTVFV